MTDSIDRTRDYWDTDSTTYDHSESHSPSSPLVQTTWATALADRLPAESSQILDMGAGTGFLSLMAAEMGHRVTAFDLSSRMLQTLSGKASQHSLDIETVTGNATEPPRGPFRTVISRHLLWTLPQPGSALAAWREVAAELVLFDSMWGNSDWVEDIRGRASGLLARVREKDSGHHAPYPTELRSSLPLGGGTHPEGLVELVAEAGWTQIRIRRLRDVEWAVGLTRTAPNRLLGVHPVYVITAVS